MLCALLHGFVLHEGSGGIGLPVDIDRSFRHTVDGLIMVVSNWPPAVDARSDHRSWPRAGGAIAEATPDSGDP
jgi:hypothetical protein